MDQTSSSSSAAPAIHPNAAVTPEAAQYLASVGQQLMGDLSRLATQAVATSKGFVIDLTANAELLAKRAELQLLQQLQAALPAKAVPSPAPAVPLQPAAPPQPAPAPKS